MVRTIPRLCLVALLTALAVSPALALTSQTLTLDSGANNFSNPGQQLERQTNPDRFAPSTQSPGRTNGFQFYGGRPGSEDRLSPFSNPTLMPRNFGPTYGR